MKIKDYGIIGDANTVALVGKNGSIDWCCLPKFDSPSVFAKILDKEKGGFFKLEPAEEYVSRQEYLPNTNILKTIFKTKEGIVELLDFMPYGFDLEREAVVSYSEVHRILVGKKGQVKMSLVFDPRFKYAEEVPELTINQKYIVARGHKKIMYLVGNINFTEKSFVVKKDQRRHFVMYSGSMIYKPLSYFNPQKKFLLTKNFWETWIKKSAYKGMYKEYLERSLLVLKLLSYSSEGSFVAAATTSLPETLGGKRNWDYRYNWIRDAVFTLQAFYMLGFRTEARNFVHWITRICLRDGIGLQIMYGLEGERNLPEKELSHLAGYANSRPVRIGNAAYQQFQLDIYGEVIDFYHMYMDYNGEIDRNIRIVIINLIEYVCRHWQDRDSGLWEMRSTQKQFTYSLLMCWVALDRGVDMARRLCWNVEVHRWEKVKETIKKTILADCWNEKLGYFTQAAKDESIDASALLIPLYGLLPFSDKKVISTINKVHKLLGVNDFVFRYQHDEFQEKENSFLLCTFWLITCLHKIGSKKKAKEILTKVLSNSNDLKIFSEEIDPQTGEYFGNYPQAFSHIGLINCILSLEE